MSDAVRQAVLEKLGKEKKKLAEVERKISRLESDRDKLKESIAELEREL